MLGGFPLQAPAVTELAAVRALARSDARRAGSSYLNDVAADIRREGLLPLAATMVERIEELCSEQPGALYVAQEVPASVVGPSNIAAYALAYTAGAAEGLAEALGFWSRRAAEDQQIADNARPAYRGQA